MKKWITFIIAIVLTTSLGVAPLRSDANRVKNNTAVTMNVEDINNNERYVDIVLPKTKAGATVEAYWWYGTRTATVKSDGKAVIDLGSTPLQAGMLITFILKNSKNGNTAEVEKRVQWSKINVPTVTNIQKSVTVTMSRIEKDAIVVAKWGSKFFAVGTVDATGKAVINFNTTIPTGTNIRYTVYSLPFVSAPVIQRKVVLATPAVWTVTSASTIVRGTATPGTTVIVNAAKKMYRGTVNSKGEYSINVSRKSPGTMVSAYTVDSKGNRSTTITKKVLLPTPVLNSISTNTTDVVVKAMPGTTAYVTVGKTTLKKTVSSRGTVFFKITKQRKGTAISVYVQDSKGNRSNVVSTKVR